MSSARGATPRYHLTRQPSELATRRLYVTRRAGPRTGKLALCARAFELYRDGAPCWRHPHCMDHYGHYGPCELPESRTGRAANCPAWCAE
jgi:hypothetical protein